ncbi:class I SAM-dependent methyltransferase [Alkalimarinus sediminis]|uniref:Protein N-lysine methyltransferase family protein n=1 Tax=Alkalimarinus sediminis TaxID=1632866 RepID=A0A9E8KP85_9ALTE|nr:protein N-lysine methyltransferase family protein [Alkalimarinus sediminis]UZW74494.1 protein N-lysine methyltransferase family protein [Alkalimarinus sediminis]
MTNPLRVRYQTVEFGSTDIHLCTLRDKQEYSDPEGVAHDLGISDAQWSLFGIIWPSSLVLAHHMFDYPTAGKRILEVGCGMALSSLLLNKQDADITATDYHPEVEFFLQRNTKLNNGNDIAFEQADWKSTNDTLKRFDIIIGSDLLYEDQHIEQLASFIGNHANPACEVIVVDPGRGRKNKLSLEMDKLGFTHDHIKPEATDYLELPFKGHILRFSRLASAA